MRLASALFLVLVVLSVVFNFTPWMGGNPTALNALRGSVLLVYLALAFMLWRGNRVAAIAAVLVASAGLLLLGAGTFFLWPVVSDELSHMAGAVQVTATMFIPVLFNLLIVVVLLRTLLSNNRWRGP